MRPSASLWLPGSCLFLACALAAQTSAPFGQAQGRPPAPGVWTYGGTQAQTRHSPLTQINRANVKQLEVAWTFDTGEPGGLQTQPLVIGDVLYGYTPTHKLFAVNAATGVRQWVFDSGIFGTGPNRGVMYWASGSERRVFAAAGNYVYALDAATGKPFDTFGAGGRIDLRENLGRDRETQGVRLTSPGVIYKDLMILGGRVGEGLPTSPGDVRAYDVRTGALRWSFHTIPHPGEFGYSTWPKEAWQYSGGANSWPGMALDEPRGLVYVPTGSAASDFYGADRLGDNLFGNSLIALDAATGKRMWHFQVIRHDVWDRDLPSPPTLVTVRRGGRTIDAVAQATKHGFLFVFDRVSGEPVFPIEYKEFPASTLTGEITSKTQPIPSKPAPFSRQLLTADLLSNRTPAVHQAALDQFQSFRSEGQFVPLGVGKPTVVFPGFDGGAEWGGQAFDPDTGLYYVNANDLAWTGALEPNTGGRFVGPATGGGHPLINNAFRFTGYKKFLDADGYPAVAPPWGTLNAIDLNTGEYVWKIPLGEYPELVQQGLTNTGSENYGGPIVTAGGLVFIAATNHDRKIRAFDKATGALLWEATMPSSGNATPATYEVNGRQYLVVAAGGGKSRTGGPGGTYVAFALPR
jgi:glucose dehydrogenase